MHKNRIGLGTYPLAGPFKHVSKNQAQKIVRQFLESGGYYIDTAPLYGMGDVEELLGEVLSQFPRDKYYLSTKCGYEDVTGKTLDRVKKSGKYQDVVNACDRSLCRLKIDYIDLYFVHSPDPKTPFSETVRALVDLQRLGKIKQIGVANVSLEQLKEYNNDGNIAFVQNRFSLLNRSIYPEFESYINKNSIKIVPSQVVDRGQLTEIILKGKQRFQEHDPRKGRCEWDKKKVKVIGNWLEQYLVPIAGKLHISLAQLSLAWALKQPYIAYVLIGTTNPRHLKTNLQADSIQLDNDIMTEIESAYINLNKIIRDKFNQSVRGFRGLNQKYF